VDGEEIPPSVKRSFETPLRQRRLSTGKRCSLLGVPSRQKKPGRESTLRSTKRFMVSTTDIPMVLFPSRHHSRVRSYGKTRELIRKSRRNC